MGRRDDLLARADAVGLGLDGRWSDDTLERKVAEAEASQDANTAPAVEELTEPVSTPGPVDDGWPKRIAPCAWLDQDGNRYTDLGQAGEAVERIRRRS